jgi:hypothetical protein
MRKVLGIEGLRSRLDGAEVNFANGKKYILRFSEQTNNPWLYGDSGAIPLHRNTRFKTSSLGEVEYV